MYFVSVASVDSNGVESLFSAEQSLAGPTALEDAFTRDPYPGVKLLQNKPNPFDEATLIGVWTDKTLANKQAFIQITLMVQ